MACSCVCFQKILMLFVLENKIRTKGELLRQVVLGDSRNVPCTEMSRKDHCNLFLQRCSNLHLELSLQTSMISKYPFASCIILHFISSYVTNFLVKQMRQIQMRLFQRKSSLFSRDTNLQIPLFHQMLSAEIVVFVFCGSYPNKWLISFS